MTRCHVVLTRRQTLVTSPLSNGFLRRNCDCGQKTFGGGECEACQKGQSVLKRHRIKQAYPNRQLDSSFQTLKKSHFQSGFNRVAIQPKLKIGDPNDQYEQEANRIAEQVMRMPEPKLRRQIEEEGEELLQTKSLIQRWGSGSEGGTEAPPIVHDVLRSPGQPLDLNTRQFMESRFGHDFSQVRVHVDPKTAKSAQAINARAFTVGHHVFFGAGQYRPEMTRGRHILAHELAHTIQQDNHLQGWFVQRMAACPAMLNASDPIPSGWKAYNGDPRVFHCGYRGILEDRLPSPEDPQNECFYDEYGRLVDEHHEHAGCRGTPNQYDSASDWWSHTFEDEGGIWARGWDAFWSSRGHDLDETAEPFREIGYELRKALDWRNWYRLSVGH